MRVLMVGMLPSIHLARVTHGVMREGVEVGLFPAIDGPINPAFPPEVTVLEAGRSPLVPARAHRPLALARAIRDFRPDVVHVHEIHFAGHLTAAAYRLLRRPPPLVQSVWGSDLYLRPRLPEERPRIARTLQRVDVLIMECARDAATARNLGFAGRIADPMSVAGGFDLDALTAFRTPGPSSSRRLIALKGYQHFAGRAQVALRAFELLGERLGGYTLGLYSANDSEVALARRACRRSGMELEVVSRNAAWAPHEEMLRLHGRARVSLGLSIADGAGVSFMETLAMGSLPIQSGTACVNEWFTDGVGGLVVPPEDPRAVAKAIERAVSDDALVDRAAELNEAVTRERLDDAVLRRRLVDIYESLA